MNAGTSASNPGLVPITSVEDLGREVNKLRLSQSFTQKELANLIGSGNRFVVDLERGKSTIQLGKVLDLLQKVGVKMYLEVPSNEA